MKITFVCWIRDEIRTVAEFGFDFSRGCQEPSAIKIFLKEIKTQA